MGLDGVEMAIDRDEDARGKPFELCGAYGDGRSVGGQAFCRRIAQRRASG
eukprot:CAMPEP_0119332634 /NCGR_PEP_ID=MMETSP1333-20130426/83219_1 /TAXON_ID=418940 /ORGANISM="Scyphosphaera apsteinii, Strain RCC1455" /LENGTH=49 /DNA_ID= /DNA_START= /DNA_END= /DNA_ORIENTATION=